MENLIEENFFEEKRKEITSIFDKDKKTKFELGIALFLYGLIIILWNFTAWRVEWTWRAFQFFFPLIVALALSRPLKIVGVNFENLNKNIALGLLVGFLIAALALYPLKKIPPLMPQSLGSGTELGYAILLILSNMVPLELFFRGFIQPRLELFAGPIPALLTVSIISGFDFWESWILSSGVFHPGMVMGTALVFGLLYLKTRSVVAPIIAHVIFLTSILLTSIA